MRRSLLAVLTGLLLVPGPSALQAQDRNTIRVPGSAKFVVHIDINTFRQTKLGGKLFELARKEAMRELHGGDQDHFAKVRETLGFDPFTEVDAITVVGSDFEKPEDHVHIMLQLRKTSGNLEGLAASLPGYSSSAHGSHTIHTATPHSKQKVFAAIHTDRQGTKRVLAAHNEGGVRAMLDHLDGKSRADSKAITRKAGTFVHVELLGLPQKELGEWPHANVAKLIQGVALQVGDSDGDISVALTLTTREEEQATQIQQMVQGVVAMVQLAHDDDEDLRRAQELLKNLKVKRDGSTVRVEISVPEQKVIDLIQDEMHLSF